MIHDLYARWRDQWRQLQTGNRPYPACRGRRAAPVTVRELAARRSAAEGLGSEFLGLGALPHHGSGIVVSFNGGRDHDGQIFARIVTREDTTARVTFSHSTGKATIEWEL